MTSPADSLRAVLDSVFAGPAYVWAEPWRPLAFLSRWWDALLDWLVALNQRNPQAFTLLYWSLVAGLVLIFVHAGWVLFRTVRAQKKGDSFSSLWMKLNRFYEPDPAGAI